MQVCIVALRPVAVSGTSLVAAPGYGTDRTVPIYYTRLQASIVQQFDEEAGQGQAFVYAQYSDASVRDITGQVDVTSNATDSFNITALASGGVNVQVSARFNFAHARAHQLCALRRSGYDGQFCVQLECIVCIACCRASS